MEVVKRGHKSFADSGTLVARLEGESLRRFEDCWLCLHIALNPVCTIDGYIFCRDCLMGNLEAQKRENDLRYQEWEAKHFKMQRLKKQRLETDRERELTKFLRDNQALPIETSNSHDTPLNSPSQTPKQGRTTDKAASRAASFWIAENTPQLPESNLNDTSKTDSEPESSPQQLPTPKKHFFCPISKRRLRIKELLTLHPICQKQKDTTMGEEKQNSWVCAVTKKQICHKQALAIKPSGQIVLEECYQHNLLVDFIPGHPHVGPSDIIRLIPGGTSFSAHNKVEVKLVRPVME